MGIYRYLYLLFLIPSLSMAQGLQFKSKDNLIYERTSYHVFASRHESFHDLIHISFEIFFEYESSSGYIFRIKWEGEPDVYNLSYSSHSDRVDFNLNQEGKTNLATLSFDKTEFELNKWNKLDVLFDLKGGLIRFAVKDKAQLLKQITLTTPAVPQITFGRSEYLIDVPKFAIRNLVVRDNKQTFGFPLNESSGTVVHDDGGTPYGWVDNPVWLINDAYYWTLRQVLTSTSVACVNFNPNTQEVYLLNMDSITVYNIRSGIKKTMPYANKTPWFGNIGTNFIDTARNKIYIYDLYSKADEATIASLDLSNLSWSVSKFPSFPNPLHHHSGYFDPTKNQYLVFGGFGDKHYSNDFYRYTVHSEKWEWVDFGGDVISPRYFSTMGLDQQTNHLYVFGGMGSESGDQYVGRIYNYDLYQLDLEAGKIEKQWKVDMPRKNVVPGRGIVVTDSFFYTLCYPEYFTNSHLALYRFSLNNGDFSTFGDSIPIRSEKIKTNANLFYSHKTHELCALVQEFDNDDIASSIKIYTLTFPPVTLESLKASPPKNDYTVGFAIVAGVIIVSTTLIFMRKRLRKKNKPLPDTQPVYAAPRHSTRANAVYLFGEFTVMDRHNHNINYMFSDKLQQLFIVLLHNSMDEGITGQRLNEMLWPGRAAEKVKNSRGVAINHLRRILKEMDGISLIYDRKVYRIEFGEDFYCDYLHCLSIASLGNTMEKDRELIGIISRGKFLKNNDLPIFDTFKHHIESTVGSALVYGMYNCYKADEHAKVIAFAEALFEIDPFNEEALAMLIKSMNQMKLTEEAKKRYYLFIAEYKKSYGVEFSKPYNSFG